MRVTLDYGRTGLDVELPDDRVVGPLGIKPLPPLADPVAAIEIQLRNPIGSTPLRMLAQDKLSACILICDITRPVPNAVILPPILRTLEAAGIERSAITILIATGLHRPNEGDELVELVGPEIASKYRVENHFGQDLDAHTNLGVTDRGVPVWIDSRYIYADLKIATGLIEPHFMAGYSGGRKLICPGIAALETIKVWHGPEFLEHPLADNGQIAGNPVHEENTRIARMAGCDFIVNVTLDDQRRITSVVAGDMEAAFHTGVNAVREVVKAEVPHPCEIVVTSGAGYPLDTTFYQAVKGMSGALPIVAPGGTIIIAASLTEGIGSPHFQQLFHEHASLEAFMQRIVQPGYFVMDQWQLEKLARVRKTARVKVVSHGLSPETLRTLFVEPAASVEQAVADSLAEYGPRAKIAVIPKGPYVLPVVAGR